MIGFPATDNSGLGICFVRGKNLVPLPAASTTAVSRIFTTDFYHILNCLVSCLFNIIMPENIVSIVFQGKHRLYEGEHLFAFE